VMMHEHRDGCPVSTPRGWKFECDATVVEARIKNRKPKTL